MTLQASQGIQVSVPASKTQRWIPQSIHRQVLALGRLRSHPLHRIFWYSEVTPPSSQQDFRLGRAMKIGSASDQQPMLIGQAEIKLGLRGAVIAMVDLDRCQPVCTKLRKNTR